MNKLKVAFITTDLFTGGAELMLYKLLSAIDRERFYCEVISLTGPGQVDHLIEKLGIKVRSLGMRPSVPDIRALLQLSMILKEIEPHTIQTWMYHADLLGSLANLLANRSPLVWGIRNNILDPKSTRRTTYLTVKLCAYLSKRLPARIVTNSHAAVDVHSRLGYTAEKMQVIPNGFDTLLFKPDPEARQSVRQEFNIPDNTPLIGLIARYDPLKDHLNFIKAAAMLNKDHPDVHYLLCGRGITWENPTLQKWIADTGLENQFHLLGRREDMPRLTAALDISSMTSFGEAFPNVIGEAMACGVPCVATDAGDARTILGETGVIVPVRQPRPLAQAWSDILKMPQDERAKMGQAARRRVEKHYSLSVIAKQYERLYHEIIQESNG